MNSIWAVIARKSQSHSVKEGQLLSPHDIANWNQCSSFRSSDSDICIQNKIQIEARNNFTAPQKLRVTECMHFNESWIFCLCLNRLSISNTTWPTFFLPLLHETTRCWGLTTIIIKASRHFGKKRIDYIFTEVRNHEYVSLLEFCRAVSVDEWWKCEWINTNKTKALHKCV